MYVCIHTHTHTHTYNLARELQFLLTSRLLRRHKCQKSPTLGGERDLLYGQKSPEIWTKETY